MLKIMISQIIIMFTLPAVAGFGVVSGCEEEDYVVGDLVASVATQGMAYTPRCLKVVVGSTVTLSASAFHPLAPIGESTNPIRPAQDTQVVEFQQPGVFGYFCPHHGSADGEGMAGAIWVVDPSSDQGDF
jgi:plastocyanin